jgi:Tfp pilus assembly PilM family ATPase
MPRLVAIEWDAQEARVVIARTRAGGVGIEHALTIPLPAREAGAAESDVGPVLAKALAEYGVSRTETLVAVGRASIELKFLSTPPAPPEELPELVRFQALRQFTSLGDDWPLDFVPLAASSDGGNNVLAAAISPDLIAQIRQTAAACNLHLSRLVLRPFAAAGLLKKEAADGKCRMVVDLLKDDADLTVLIGEHVIFPRTVRLPAVDEADVLARALLNEGRRTIIAAQNQLGGRRVEEVVIFGDGQHHAAIKQLLEKELTMPVKLVDPFDYVEWSDGARVRKPEFPGTFAPLLGMLLAEAGQAAHSIDFLHPRKRPAAPNQNRVLIAGGAAIAALLLLGLGSTWWQLRSLDAQIGTLQTQRTAQEKLAKQGAKPRDDAAKLDRFALADVTWLDELRLISEKFPAPGAALVEDLTANYDPKGGGKLTVTGLVDQEGRIRELEGNIRDEAHSISGSGAQYDPEAPGSQKWRFKETVTIRPSDADAAPASAPSPTKGKAPAKAAPKTPNSAKASAAGGAS